MRPRGWAIVLLPVVMVPASAWAADAVGTPHGVFTNIALCMVSACVMGLLRKMLRQPLILGYGRHPGLPGYLGDRRPGSATHPGRSAGRPSGAAQIR